MLKPDLPFYDDPEGERLPQGISRVIDAHVHVFPDGIFSAVRSWFDAFAWKIRYQASSEELITFLLDRGVDHVVALQYAHKPGIAVSLNNYMLSLCDRFPGRVTGLATVFPGEEGIGEILETAFDKGLGGVKLHVHVQCFDMNGPDMDPVYEACQRRGRPLVIHAGREPKSDHYLCDPYQLCRADKVASVMKNFPRLRICVPHLGFDESAAYAGLAEKYEGLYLDTAMVITDYFPAHGLPDLASFPSDRVMYGSDFPNIPYEWDRELKVLANSGLAPERLDRILFRNAAQFFGIPGFPSK